MRTILLFLACLCAAVAAWGQSAGIVESVVTYSATPTFTATAGITDFTITLTGNVTSSTFSSPAVGIGSFTICQNATGGYTFAWPPGSKGFGTPDLTINACSRQMWKYDGATLQGVGPMFSDSSYPLSLRSVAFNDPQPVTSDSGLYLLIDPVSPINITRVYCAAQGGTNVVMNLDKRTEAAIATDSGHHLLGADLTAVNSGANTSTFANGSSQCGSTSYCQIAAHNPVVVTITSVSGSVNALNCSFDFQVVTP